LCGRVCNHDLSVGVFLTHPVGAIVTCQLQLLISKQQRDISFGGCRAAANEMVICERSLQQY
jgi:hypothetical protein